MTTSRKRPPEKREPDRAERTCHICGTAITAAPYARARQEYCCERCFLARHKQSSLATREGEIENELVEAMVCALDIREHETGLHSKRVACHTLVLAKHFTDDPHVLRQVYWGALLHDIGKIGVPDAILLKHGSLTESEWLVMRTHPELGHRVLAGVRHMAPAADIVLCHEERFDGTGYPRALAGDAIPLWARLFAIIDTLDAITSERPYRKAHSFDTARVEILRQSGTQFDPVALEVFVAEEKTLRAMVDLKCGTADIDLLLPQLH